MGVKVLDRWGTAFSGVLDGLIGRRSRRRRANMKSAM
jgi:hypothetical protein